MIRIVDLSWAAGFIEGEGCFTANQYGVPIIEASQVQLWPLERLRRLFGGNIRVMKRDRILTPKWNDAGRWFISGKNAVAIMLTLFTFLSPNRRKKIKLLVMRWKAIPLKREGLKINIF